jgi:RHS repeat-associated protein
LGSTRALTDSVQATTDTYLCDAWGNPLSSTGTTINPFRWVGNVGYYFDSESGLYYIRARVYQPTIARWTSVDPLFYMLARSGRISFLSRDPIGYHSGSSKYKLAHILQRCDPLGLKEWIVGQEAATVSFIAQFTPTADTFWEMMDEANRIGRQPLQIGELAVFMSLLANLAATANPTPKDSYATWNTLRTSMEYRGFSRMHVEIACDCGYRITDVDASDLEADVGYTPRRTAFNPNITAGYDRGEGSSPPPDIAFADSIDAGTWVGQNTNAFCVRVVLKNQFRIGGLGQIMSKWLLGVGVPFAWADMDYRLCCDTQNQVDFSGSNFPTHFAYVDKAKVGSRPQRGLAAFIYRTPNARAQGGSYHVHTGNGTRITR